MYEVLEYYVCTGYSVLVVQVQQYVVLRIRMEIQILLDVVVVML
jgi:hypothetical protein